MNNTDRWQDYLYNNNIICHKCYQSHKITCEKCLDAIKRHVVSGEAEGWDPATPNGYAGRSGEVEEDGEEEEALQRERNLENPEWRYYHPRGEE